MKEETPQRAAHTKHISRSDAVACLFIITGTGIFIWKNASLDRLQLILPPPALLPCIPSTDMTGPGTVEGGE